MKRVIIIVIGVLIIYYIVMIIFDLFIKTDKKREKKKSEAKEFSFNTEDKIDYIEYIEDEFEEEIKQEVENLRISVEAEIESQGIPFQKLNKESMLMFDGVFSNIN